MCPWRRQPGGGCLRSLSEPAQQPPPAGAGRVTRLHRARRGHRRHQRSEAAAEPKRGNVAASPAGAVGGPAWPNHLGNCGPSGTTDPTTTPPYASLPLVPRTAPLANCRSARSVRTDAGHQPGSGPVGKFGGGGGFCVKAETLAVASEARGGHCQCRTERSTRLRRSPPALAVCSPTEASQ